MKVIPLAEDSVGTVRSALLLLTGAVALVLLIACANVANLFLARAATRQRELAVRAALGAGRWRLTRQVLVEAVLLSVVGGLLGLLLASWAIDLLLALQPRGIPRLREVGIDGTVLAFTLLVAIAVGTAFGLLPALTMSPQDPAESFRGESRGASERRPRTRFRSALVVRSDLPPETLGPAIKAAVHEIDPEQPISRLREAGELLQDATARQRFNMSLLTLFGILALTLAGVGVYGVMAYGVHQRTRELGIRLALGAGASSVQSMVLRQGLMLTVSGLALGLVP